MKSRFFALLLGWVGVLPALAHPGHGGTGLHHSWGAYATIGIMALLFYIISRVSKRSPDA